jgi:hypothetical protein
MYRRSATRPKKLLSAGVKKARLIHGWRERQVYAAKKIG